jgi:hypothetical protein
MKAADKEAPADDAVAPAQPEDGSTPAAPNTEPVQD